MSKGTLLVVGAAGDVGQGIVEAALSSGRQVIATGRDGERLRRLSARMNSDSLACIMGDIRSETGAAALWVDASKVCGEIDDVVVSVSAPNRFGPLLELDTDDLTGLLLDNLLVHFIAARVFLARMRESGLFIGIGGGTADFIIPKLAYASMVQAALRMMYRGLARERQGGATLRELMIVSMVNGESNRARAKPEWVTDLDIGKHVCAILEAPERFPGPVLQLKSREQVGSPE
jgi:NAD(P)-dependent dehydrogenase (short-subunit alcohol dehydrogenase family)